MRLLSISKLCEVAIVLIGKKEFEELFCITETLYDCVHEACVAVVFETDQTRHVSRQREDSGGSWKRRGRVGETVVSSFGFRCSRSVACWRWRRGRSVNVSLWSFWRSIWIGLLSRDAIVVVRGLVLGRGSYGAFECVVRVLFRLIWGLAA